MRNAAILSLLLLSSAGCAAQLRAQGSPQGATVRATVQGDARATAAAGLLAAGLAALTEGGSGDSQPAAPPAVHTPAVAAVAGGVSVQVGGVVLVDADTGAALRTVSEGSVRVAGSEGALAGASITSGRLRVREVSGRVTVLDGTLTVSTGRTLRATQGELTVEPRDGARCAVREGSLLVDASAGSVASPSPAEASVRIGVGVEVTVVRVALGGGPDVLGGGALRIDGAPDLAGLRVIDGRLDPRGGAVGINARASARTGAQVELGGGCCCSKTAAVAAGAVGWRAARCSSRPRARTLKGSRCGCPRRRACG